MESPHIFIVKMWFQNGKNFVHRVACSVHVPDTCWVGASALPHGPVLHHPLIIYHAVPSLASVHFVNHKCHGLMHLLPFLSNPYYNSSHFPSSHIPIEIKASIISFYLTLPSNSMYSKTIEGIMDMMCYFIS